jgi:predicted acetyltransferase
MDEITIRQIDISEATILSRTLASYAFLHRPTPPLPTLEEQSKSWAHLDEASFFAAFDGTQPVGSLGSSPLTQNIRGTLFPGSGIWKVTTHPAARRKGVAREMMRQCFEYLRQEDYAVALLYAFRESFYTRLGFTTFTQPHLVRFAPEALQPLLKKNLPGKVERVEIAQGYQEHRTQLHLQHENIHGMALFTPHRASELKEKNAYWLAIARVGNEIKGTMLYTITGYKEVMQVTHFWYTDSLGRYLLLEWLARHIDHVKEIEIKLPPFEHPETWWPDMEIHVSSVEPPLGRIIDITRINGMQVGRGRFTARVSDEYCPWNEGNYLFECVNNRLQIQPYETAECELSIQAISALIYGTHEPESFAIRGWGNPSLSIQATMQHMFPPQQPYLYERF